MASYLRRRSQTRVLINALSTAPGGSLTYLLGILEGFRSIGFGENVSVVASYPETVNVLRERGWNPICTDVRGALSRAVWETCMLNQLVSREGASLLYSSNFATLGVSYPQVVLHQSAHTVAPYSVNTDPERYVRFAVQKTAARISLHLANASLFVSEYLRNCAEKIAPRAAARFSVVPYGLGELFRNVALDQKKPRPLTYRLAAVQTPSYHKDNETLLQSFKILVERYPDRPWTLDIAGWLGWSRWQARAQQLGIADRVQWHGFLDERGIINLLSNSDALVFTSLLESFGLPIIEAMACGCPVIAVRSTAIPEISAGAALFVPERSPDRVAKAVHLLTENQNLRWELIRAGRKRALDFSWTNAAKRHVDTFERVLATWACDNQSSRVTMGTTWMRTR